MYVNQQIKEIHNEKKIEGTFDDKIQDTDTIFKIQRYKQRHKIQDYVTYVCQPTNQRNPQWKEDRRYL